MRRPPGATRIDPLFPYTTLFRSAFTPLDRMALEQRIGGLRPGWTRGLAEPSTMDIDVAALHAACLRAATKAGAKIANARRLLSARREGAGWRIETTAGPEIGRAHV